MGDLPLRTVTEGGTLTRHAAREAGRLLASGQAESLQVAAFLGALAARGEKPQELAGLAEAFREVAVPCGAFPNAVDTCGTGGDGQGSFNVSTAAAVVVASLGVPVAKHGNRSVSSRCGSADLLEAAGYPVQEAPARARARMERCGFAFLFAPSYHPAMAFVAPIRRAMGVRTAFNLLGPLLNPAGVRRQVVGVFRPEALELMAHAFVELGAERVLLVHGAGGFDEAVLWGETLLVEVAEGRLARSTLTPSHFGFPEGRPEDVAGGTPQENLALFQHLLAGEAPEGLARAVAANAALAMRASGSDRPLSEEAERALTQLRSGAVATFFRDAIAPLEEQDHA